MSGNMPGDAAIAALCTEIYQPTAPTAFDHYDAGTDDGICWAIKRLEGFDVVVFRGSKTLEDWLRDVQARATPSRIGHVHSGFYAGMEHMWADLRPLLSQPAIVTGHSLGAARAAVLAALMTVDGAPLVARVVFGEPKPGLLDFAKLITGIAGRSYRNGDDTHHDLVTDLPLSFPPTQFVHPTPIIPVCCRPTGDLFSTMGVFAYHHIELYRAALAAVQPQEKVA
jgi:pimeloyl-ACP methyl ester carboxylesterase